MSYFLGLGLGVGLALALSPTLTMTLTLALTLTLTITVTLAQILEDMLFTLIICSYVIMFIIIMLSDTSTMMAMIISKSISTFTELLLHTKTYLNDYNIE